MGDDVGGLLIDGVWFVRKDLALLVQAEKVAAEREACARIVDELAQSFSPVGATAARQIAGAIRAGSK